MEFIKKKTDLPNEVFEKLINYAEMLIIDYNRKSLHLTDEDFRSKNIDLYDSVKKHFSYKGETYLTIRIASSDNSINNQFHYDGHFDSTVIPLKFENFKKDEKNGDLYISKKSRNANDGWIINLFKKIIMQNRIYRYILTKYFDTLSNKFDKVEMDVGDEISFNGFRVFHGNTKLEGDDKIRASLIVHSQALFDDNIVFRFIKYLRHRRNHLN